MFGLFWIPFFDVDADGGRVDIDLHELAMALDRESRDYYLAHSDSPTRELEAKIYGAAISAFVMARIEEKQDMPAEQANAVMIPVAMRLIGMHDDPDVGSLHSIPTDESPVRIRSGLLRSAAENACNGVAVADFSQTLQVAAE